MEGQFSCGSNCELILLIQTKLDHLTGGFRRSFLAHVSHIDKAGFVGKPVIVILFHFS